MKIVTHNGKFHADDIFAVATLLMLYPGSEVVRSRDEEVIASGDIVVDVGFVYDSTKKRFDHHQPGGAGERENGVPYAGFGLVWKEWGAEVAGGEEEARLIDNRLVVSVDAHDNGFLLAEPKFQDVRTYTIADFFYTYYYTSGLSDEELQKSFLGCVDMAQDLLRREITRAKKIVSDGRRVEEIYNQAEDKRLIMLDEESGDLAWGNVLIEKKEPLYVMYPRTDGNWAVKAVNTGLNTYEVRKPFPADWGGKKDRDLQGVTGVSDAIFCHRGLFICSAQSKEGAIKLAQLALDA